MHQNVNNVKGQAILVKMFAKYITKKELICKIRYKNKKNDPIK